MIESPKEPPNSHGVEKAILSVIMQDPSRIDELSTLTNQHFYDYGHQVIFSAIKSTLDEGNNLELVTFVDKITKLGLIEKCGGVGEIASLYSFSPATVNIKNHVDIITEAYARRVAIDKASGIIDAAYNEQIEDVSKNADETASHIESILNSSVEVKTLKEILRESFDRFQSRVEGKTDSMGIPTLPLIDRYLRGLHGGRIMVIGAYPSGGKSILASQIVINAVLNSYPAAFISLEMQERDIMDRMLVQASGVVASAFSEPLMYKQLQGAETLQKGVTDRLKAAAINLSKSPLQIFKCSNNRLRTVLGLIRKTHRENKSKVVAIDYIQLIQDDAATTEAKLANISHALQQIAGELDITILVLTQLNAEGETKHGRVIEEDADAFLTIVQDRNKESETYKQHRYILVSKDRHYGNSGERIKLIFNKEKIVFEEGEDETNAAKITQKAKFVRK